MPKRFTDTDKWKDDWYLSLNNDYRIVWQWLLDNCSHAGICKRNIGLVNLMCNVNITEDELIQTMEGRIIVLKTNWFIPNFIKFQYASLNNAKPAILSVVKDLFKYDCVRIIPESFGNSYRIIADCFDNHYLMIKDKDKDKDKDSSTSSKKNKNSENGFSGNYKAQGEELFAQRHRRWLEEDDTR